MPTRILVVEDNDDAREMCNLMLRRLGYEVLNAVNGQEGLDIAQESVPDLILLDIMMPGMDGYEVCNRLRQNPIFRRVPIIFLTALDEIDDRVKAYTMGADDFLTKGQVTPRELEVRIKASLARTERLRESDAAGIAGSAVGLFSLRGGVGVSSLALNLAAYAVEHCNMPVMVIDMAFPVGSMGLWSGYTGKRHSVELLSNHPSELTLPQINHYALQHIQGFFVIPGPQTLVDLNTIQPGALEQVLTLLRKENYFVILDLGRPLPPLTWRVLRECDWTVAVTTPDITARKMASLALEMLPHQGIDQRKLLLLYNDITNVQPANPAIGLPRPPDAVVPYTPDLQGLGNPGVMLPLWSLVEPTGMVEDPLAD